MGELVTAREAVKRLVCVNRSDLDLAVVLSNSGPDHVHWKEKILPNGQAFETKPDLYDWFYRSGLPYFVWAKIAVRLGLPAQKVSDLVLEKYFQKRGIYGEIQVLGNGLFDYRRGVRIDKKQTSSNWDSQNTTKLFPEIDFRVDFNFPDADPKIQGKIQREIFMMVNTTKMSAPPEETTFRPDLIYQPLSSTPIIASEGYLSRIDTFLKNMGLNCGVDGLVATRQSVNLIKILENSTVPRT